METFRRFAWTISCVLLGGSYFVQRWFHSLCLKPVRRRAGSAFRGALEKIVVVRCGLYVCQIPCPGKNTTNTGHSANLQTSMASARMTRWAACNFYPRGYAPPRFLLAAISHHTEHVPPRAFYLCATPLPNRLPKKKTNLRTRVINTWATVLEETSP